MWLTPRKVIGLFGKIGSKVSGDVKGKIMGDHSNVISSQSLLSIGDTMTNIVEKPCADASVEPIHFDILGDLFNILNVRVPKSTIFNIRSDNNRQHIISSTGNISKMSVDGMIIDKSKSSTKGILYQSCLNNSGAMSLLLGLNSQNANFAVLHVCAEKRWVVKEDGLSIWPNNGLEIHPIPSLSRFVQVSGNGKFAISSPGTIIQIQLAEGENICLNPRAIVGYTSLEDNCITKNNTERRENELISGFQRVTNVGVSQIVPFKSYMTYVQKLAKSTLVLGKTTIQKMGRLLSGTVASRTKQEGSGKLITERKVEEHKFDVKMKAGSINQQNGEKKLRSTETKKRGTTEWTEKLYPVLKTTRNICYTFGNMTWKTLNNILHEIKNFICVYFAGYKGDYLVCMKGPKTVLVHNAINLKTQALTESELKRLKI
mgnify:FL=1